MHAAFERVDQETFFENVFLVVLLVGQEVLQFLSNGVGIAFDVFVGRILHLFDQHFGIDQSVVVLALLNDISGRVNEQSERDGLEMHLQKVAVVCHLIEKFTFFHAEFIARSTTLHCQARNTRLLHGRTENRSVSVTSNEQAPSFACNTPISPRSFRILDRVEANQSLASSMSSRQSLSGEVLSFVVWFPIVLCPPYDQSDGRMNHQKISGSVRSIFSLSMRVL